MVESNELSTLNVSAIKRLAESVGWQELEREMLLMIEDLRNLLETSNEDAELNRGRINGIRTILAWPEVIIEEAALGDDDDETTEMSY